MVHNDFLNDFVRDAPPIWRLLEGEAGAVLLDFFRRQDQARVVVRILRPALLAADDRRLSTPTGRVGRELEHVALVILLLHNSSAGLRLERRIFEAARRGVADAFLVNDVEVEDVAVVVLVDGGREAQRSAQLHGVALRVEEGLGPLHIEFQVVALAFHQGVLGPLAEGAHGFRPSRCDERRDVGRRALEVGQGLLDVLRR